MTSASTKGIQDMARQAQKFLAAGAVYRAEKICDKALNHGAKDPDMLLQTGKVRYFRKRHDEAAALFQQALNLRPTDSEARIMLWASYRDGGDFEAMLKLAHQFQNNPLNANEVFIAYRSFLSSCDWSSAEKIQDKIFTLVKKGKIRHDLIPALLIELCGIPGLPPELVFDLHRQWGNKEIKGKQPYFPANTPAIKASGRLKVGYLSADFKLHPVGFFMNRVIASHNRRHFDIYCYAHIGRDDSLTRNIREHADHFVDITALPNDEVAARIHADGINILIDLGGHTTDTRLPVLAYRPAPVQITYLGYPNTSGLPAVDFRITDRHAECEEGSRYVEKLLYMPQSFLCYGVDPSGLRTAGTPVEEKDHITFASFNNVRKMTPYVIRVWSRILDRVPGSRLALKARGLEARIVRDNILSEFAGHGIQAERIEFRPYTKTYEDHMIQYNDIDIALDTFPYNGTTTTCDALAMGVPVVTLAGKMHAQRVSCSILKNIGFAETITHSMDAYVDKAVHLASKPANLTLLKKMLPTLFRHSILCQPEKFTRQLEGLYHQAWQDKTGNSPALTGDKPAKESKQSSASNAAEGLYEISKGAPPDFADHTPLQAKKPETEKHPRGRKLHIGGREKHPEWEILDAIPSDLTDHIGNANALSMFEDDTFKALYSSHVLEHFSYQNELSQALAEWYRVLEPGGALYVSVPNLDVLCELFLNKKELSPEDRFMVMRMMFGGQIDPYDFHKVGYNPEFLASYLNQAGFRNIRMVPSFGLFNDNSNMEFGGKPISLNLVAEKETERASS